jgi:tight adherence protein B
MPILLFLVLLVVIFGVVLLLTKPSKKEAELGKRLAGFDQVPMVDQGGDRDILKREVYSGSPIINALLQRIKLAGNLDVLIKQADSNWSVSGVLFGALALAVAVGVVIAIWLHNITLGLFLGLGSAIAPYIYLVLMRRARLNRFAALLPDAIDLMSRALRAGHAVTAAIEMVAREVPNPVGKEFRHVFEEQNFGLPLREALLNLAKRVPVPDLQFLVTALLVQKETGGNLAEILDKTGAVIRERSRLLGQLRIYTAQGKMTGWILGLLPFIVFVLMLVINPEYSGTLIEDPAGRLAIWIGLGLMSVGAFMIHKIVDIKV